jgi:hypothetical protein
MSLDLGYERYRDTEPQSPTKSELVTTCRRMFYVWTIWHRMKKVEAEMRMLDQRIGRRELATRR